VFALSQLLGSLALFPVRAFAVVDTCNGLTATIVGTDAADVLTGTPGNDVVVAKDGNDTINGNGGNDTICAGKGVDTAATLGGDDWIDGEDGNDLINAGHGNNIVFGGKNDDDIVTGNGNDRIDGGDNVDVISSGGGDDIVAGGKNNDTILAGAGNDSVSGGDNNDNIDGGSGTDYCDGGLGVNIIVNCETSNPPGAVGVLVVVKDAVPDSSQDFIFSALADGEGPGSFALDDDGEGPIPDSQAFVTFSGDYTVTEESTPGWDVTGIVCNDPDGESSVSVGEGEAFVDLDTGEVVTCTFTNTQIVASSSSSSEESSSEESSSSEASSSSEQSSSEGSSSSEQGSSSSEGSSSSDASSSSLLPECSDTVDNDGDGAIDSADFGCYVLTGEDGESFLLYNPNDNSEGTPQAQCQDGEDNDGDGVTDLSDPGCSGAQDNDEFNEPVPPPPPPPPASPSGEDVTNGAHRGHDTNVGTGVANFLADHYDIGVGNIPPGAFGGGEDLPDDVHQYLCSLQRAFPDEVTTEYLETLARHVGFLMSVNPADVLGFWSDPDNCEALNAARKPQAPVVAALEPIKVRVDANGYPVAASNPVWEACIRGEADLDILRTNPDRREDGRIRTCADYHEKDVWIHPEVKNRDGTPLEFTFNRKPLHLMLPPGFVVTRAETVTQR
jgi:Ca2+-binding RTX toxin-like protein